MNQSIQEVEAKIRKQVKEKLPLVLVERLDNGKVISVKYAEHIDVAEIKVLQDQAIINQHELAQEQLALDEKKHQDILAVQREHTELHKMSDINYQSHNKRQAIINAHCLYELDLIKGVIGYPSDYDKYIAWFEDFILGEVEKPYESVSFAPYLKKVGI